MKMFIHSCYGVLDCVPMTLQAIEKSIPDASMEQQVIQGDCIERGVVESDECPF